MSFFELFFLLSVASVSNAFPSLFLEILKLRVPLHRPLDFGMIVRDKRILGDHKTIAGSLLMIVGAYAGWFVIFLIAKLFDLEPAFFKRAPILVIPLFIGLGVLVGDAAGSFVKRRIGIAPGDDLLIVDNVDWIAGSLVVLWFLYDLPPAIEIFSLAVIFFLLHMSLDKCARYLNLRH